MKCTIKAKCSEKKFLSYTHYSLKCVYKSGYTYGFYDYKTKADIDKYNLNFGKVKNEILKGWKLARTNLKTLN